MSLTTGRGPLGPDPAGRFSPPIPRGVAYVEPHPRRVQAEVDGVVVIDTERALLVHRPGQTLVYALPAETVERARAGGASLPATPVPEAPGYVAVPWDAVDRWLEEGRLLVNYPPNPYHRVDCRQTGRRLRVTAGTAVLVDTDETVTVFETALSPRLYIHPRALQAGRLRRSDTTTYCNYKGWTTYWSAVLDTPDGETVIGDAAWSHEDPLPESLPIKGLLCFDPGKVDVHAELPGEG